MDKPNFIAFDQILPLLQELARKHGTDEVGTGYELWVQLTRFLTKHGWTPEELIRDAGWQLVDRSLEHDID